MANVISQEPPVNPVASVSEVIEWVEKQAGKGDMGESTARLRVTALRQMVEQVAPDEPQDAASVLKYMDRLRERWARRHPELQSGTAKTYATRASSTLAEYFKWSSAPDQYDPRKSAPKREDAPKKVARAADRTVEAVAPAPAAPGPLRASQEFICVLGSGRHFGYRLPPDGLNVKDAIRAAYHLITMCEDYDSSMTPMQVFATELQRTV